MKELPDKLRNVVKQKLIPSRKARNKDNTNVDNIHRVWRSKTSEVPITIHANIEGLLPAWEKQPSAFLLFTTCGINQQQSLSIAEIYRSLNSFDLRRVIDCVRRRFFLLALHQIKQDVHNLGNDFHKHISLLSPDTEQEVQKKCRTWALCGRRYSILAKGLRGLGALFLLPDDISANM